MITEKPPYLGFGLGLRPQHYQEILEGNPAIDWFEVISENYMVEGGQPLYMLDQIRERYPIVMHGVSLSIASTAPFDMDYVRALKALALRLQPKWISDHLCWTGVHGVNLHDLLPVPYTEEALGHVVDRVNYVQDFLGRRLTHRERVELRHLRPIGDDRMGIRERARTAHRLLAPVRRQQRLCQRLQSRLLDTRLSACHAARQCRPVPCGRAQP